MWEYDPYLYVIVWLLDSIGLQAVKNTFSLQFRQS